MLVILESSTDVICENIFSEIRSYCVYSVTRSQSISIQIVLV